MTVADSDDLKEGIEAFEACVDAEADNRKEALDDLRFGRLGEQWHDADMAQRQREGRPCLTISKMPAFIRQVVNDARQNKPSIKVKPVDSGADPGTAEVINGLFRNIEYISNADVAYDTAAEMAVSCGIGYIRVQIDYAHNDTFDKDIKIGRVSNPFSVYGDPDSTSADSEDWNVGFVTDLMAKSAFRRKWKGAQEVSWEDSGYTNLQQPWLDDDHILVAEWWKREESEKAILLLSNGMVVAKEDFTRADETGLSIKDWADATGVTVAEERQSRGYKTTQRIMTGAEVLETSDWAGCYIPLIPVYGEEVNIEGKRFFRSLIRDAKDAQRNFNYWRTAATELVALAPKAPFIGPKGSFKTDQNWATANTQSHAYLEYDVVSGGVRPERQPFAGVPAGALQEALNASDDMKAILGMYDASLGARSNETSGRAIMARQREGDVSTFHFVDNLQRAIRHTARVVLDLIPKVYSGPRILRILGPKGEAQTVGINGQQLEGQVEAYDLAAGKYDVAVASGPMYTTRREEAVAALTELLRAFPPAAPVVGDLLVKMMDFPEADEIAKRLQAMAGGQGVDPKMVEQMKAELEKLQQENQQLRSKLPIEMAKVETDRFEAQTDRMRAVHEITRPPEQPAQQRAF
jgi:hypothetical protein